MSLHPTGLSRQGGFHPSPAHAGEVGLRMLAGNTDAEGAPRALSSDRLPSVAVLLMSRLPAKQVPWAVSRLARGSGALGKVPGMRFARVLGSGHRGGFGLKPGLDCQGIFACFDDLPSAQHFVQESRAAQAYAARAVEGFSAVLVASSSRGTWGGQGMSAALAPRHGEPVAVLTRAAIKPLQLMPFWRHSPAAEAQLAQAPGCRLAVGLGEAPLLRQATFSLWDSTSAMEAYAQQGSHMRAIQSSWSAGYFKEWMFVRFVPVALRGSWQGRSLDGDLHG